MKFAELGIDWFELDFGEGDALNQLVRGKLLPTEEVMDALESVCQYCMCTMDELMEHAVLPNH